MKLISLNAWGGVAGLKGLLDFFRANKDVDVFCLQEIWNGGEHLRGTTLAGVLYDKFVSELYSEIGGTLKDHGGYFHPHYHDWYGLAMFIKNDVAVKKEGEVWVWKEKADVNDDEVANHAHNIHYATKESGVTSTRSSHYPKPERFADYTLVSDGIKVKDFKVLPDEISDHLAMYLEFE